MNFFGPALERTLALHSIGKQEFARSCGMDRNQITNIISGSTKAPTKIEQIFTALRAVIPLDDCVSLALYYLEDRRADIGYTSGQIAVRRADSASLPPNTRRLALVSLYDTEPEFRNAIDAIVELISPPSVALPIAAESPDAAGRSSPSSTITYPTAAQAKRAKKGTAK